MKKTMISGFTELTFQWRKQENKRQLRSDGKKKIGQVRSFIQIIREDLSDNKVAFEQRHEELKECPRKGEERSRQCEGQVQNPEEGRHSVYQRGQ